MGIKYVIDYNQCELFPECASGDYRRYNRYSEITMHLNECNRKLRAAIMNAVHAVAECDAERYDRRFALIPGTETNKSAGTLRR